MNELPFGGKREDLEEYVSDTITTSYRKRKRHREADFTARFLKEINQDSDVFLIKISDIGMLVGNRLIASKKPADIVGTIRGVAVMIEVKIATIQSTDIEKVGKHAFKKLIDHQFQSLKNRAKARGKAILLVYHTEKKEIFVYRILSDGACQYKYRYENFSDFISNFIKDV